MKKVIAFLIVLAALASCQQHTTEWSSMKLIQEKPQLFVVNLRDTAVEHGDELVFESGLRDTTGAVVGELHGWLITVDLSDSANTIPNSNMLDKIGTSVFNIDGDDIVVLGMLFHAQGNKIMNTGKPQKRAIIGGTGKFRGITGEITITRNADTTYTHELIYKID